MIILNEILDADTYVYAHVQTHMVEPPTLENVKNVLNAVNIPIGVGKSIVTINPTDVSDPYRYHVFVKFINEDDHGRDEYRLMPIHKKYLKTVLTNLKDYFNIEVPAMVMQIMHMV